jgi:membrane-associated phospholipid phosphatase
MRTTTATSRLDQVDFRLLEIMRTRGHTPLAEAPMVQLAAMAEDGAIWLALGAGLAAVDSPRRRRWLLAGACGPAAIVLNYPLKRLFRRSRPQLPLERLGEAPNELSFPSAHATSSFAAATAMARVAPRGKSLPLLLACAVAVGRPYLGMHRPSDVLAGALFGTFLGFAYAAAADVEPLRGALG